ncbi:MAG: magnesium transporter CorA family protein [Candidatus Buchananbacteria bacterium]
MQDNISTIQSGDKQMMWINIVNAGKKEIQYLKRKFKFNDLDLNDSYAQKFAQRPKFDVRNGYCFLILQFPFYNKKSKLVEAEEVNFFIGWDYVITLHRNSLLPMVELYNFCENDKFYRSQYFTGQSGFLIYELISRLQQHCYPMLDHISLDIKNIENNIFSGRERRMVNEILTVKRNILNFRRIMQAHESVINKLTREKIDFLNLSDFKDYFKNAIEHTREIWDILNNQKEILDALENTNTSLVSFKLNDVMKTLTMFSVIVFPLTLFAALFAMDTGGMPFRESPYGFWMVIGLLVVIALGMLLFFKRKKWL